MNYWPMVHCRAWVSTETSALPILEKKKQQLANRIVRLRNIESTEQRKLETRRKILAGDWILHRIDQDTDDRLRLMLMQGLDDFLEHPRDRELFDLPPKEDSE